MARTPSTATTRQPAPPPEPEVDTVYTEIWTTVSAYKPDEADQGEGESDQDYFKRLSQAIADVTEPDAEGNSEVWNAMSQEAQNWYDSTVSAAEAGEEYPPPDGFYADDVEEEPAAEEDDVVEEAAPAPAVKGSGTPGSNALMAFNAKRKAAKDAAAAANGGAPAPAPAGRRMAAPAAPLVAPGRRMAPTPAAPAPALRTPTAPARTVPVRPPAPRAAAPATPAARAPRPAPRAAAVAPAGRAAGRAAAVGRAAPMEKPKSGVEIIRELIVENPNVSADQIIDYMVENHSMEPKKTTVVSLMTSTRTAINTIKNLDHWKD